jgi:hypothetical protein
MSLLVSEIMKINFILKSHYFSIPALVEWIISASLNIHTLQIGFPQPNGFHNKIARLKKLKKLDVLAGRASDPKEVTLIASNFTTTLLTSSQIFRSCHQVEIFWMDVVYLVLGELAELEPAENMTDITLRWSYGPSIKEVLPVIKRWRHLSRLSVQDFSETFPPFEVVSDFILGMKHLSYLHIAPDYDCPNHGQLEMLRDKVNELILPRRPNFKFNISDDLKLENEFI